MSEKSSAACAPRWRYSSMAARNLPAAWPRRRRGRGGETAPPPPPRRRPPPPAGGGEDRADAQQAQPPPRAGGVEIVRFQRRDQRPALEPAQQPIPVLGFGGVGQPALELLEALVAQPATPDRQDSPEVGGPLLAG